MSIIMFNMIFEWLPHICTPHIQLSLRSLSREVNFKHRFHHKAHEDFPMTCKEGHLLALKDIQSLFEHGEVINYTLDGVSTDPVTTKMQASFLTWWPERKETAQGFHHEANGDFKTVRVKWLWKAKNNTFKKLILNKALVHERVC